MVESQMEPTHVEVVFFRRALNRPFVYRIPEGARGKIRRGSRVAAPLIGRVERAVALGFVDPPEFKTRDLVAVLDEPGESIPENLLELAFFSARYYRASLGSVFSLLDRRDDLEIVREISVGAGEPGSELGARLADLIESKGGAIDFNAASGALGVTRAELGSFLSASEGASFQTNYSTRARRARAVERREPIEEAPVRVGELTASQRHALEKLSESLKSGRFSSTLLFGVTGSGKTEVYIELIRLAARAGKSALALAPETALAEQLADRIGSALQIEPARYHSGLTRSERRASLARMRSGEPIVVVGARSAIYAPVRALGLIVVDEEHDASYKESERAPFFNGRDIAIKRASIESIPVILGSATPSVETFHNATARSGSLIEMPERVDGSKLPKMRIVMKDGDDLIGPALASAIEKRLNDGEQTLIYLNRRGSFRYTQCLEEGHIHQCRNCSAPLVTHESRAIALCHICGATEPKRDRCPECGSEGIARKKGGIEQAQAELKARFPSARIARLDSDSTRAIGARARTLDAARRGAVDILIGTQMITKGHDLSGVTLVGALALEDSLASPDFRATERAFQSIEQAAGRSGRGSRPGEAIVQTRLRDERLFEALIKHDYKIFYRDEIKRRQPLRFPPYARVGVLRIEAASILAGSRYVDSLKAALTERFNERERADLRGPVEEMVFKRRNRHHWKLLALADDHRALSELLDRLEPVATELARKSRARIKIDFDIDPLNVA